MHELQVMNVSMRIITEDNIEQLTNLSYSNNVNKLLNKENIDLEEKIQRQIGLKTEIKWNPKREAGAVKISVSSLEQFDALLEKLGVQTR